MCWPFAVSRCTTLAMPSQTMWIDFVFWGFAKNKHSLPPAKRVKGKWRDWSGKDIALEVPWRPSCLGICLSLQTLLPCPLMDPEQKAIVGLSQTIKQRSSFNYLKTRGLYSSNWMTSQESVFLFWSSWRIGNSPSKWPSLILIEWCEHCSCHWLRDWANGWTSSMVRKRKEPAIGYFLKWSWPKQGNRCLTSSCLRTVRILHWLNPSQMKPSKKGRRGACENIDDAKLGEKNRVRIKIVIFCWRWFPNYHLSLEPKTRFPDY